MFALESGLPLLVDLETTACGRANTDRILFNTCLIVSLHFLGKAQRRQVREMNKVIHRLFQEHVHLEGRTTTAVNGAHEREHSEMNKPQHSDIDFQGNVVRSEGTEPMPYAVS